MIPVMVEYVSGAPTNAKIFIMSIFLGRGIFFVPLTLNQYSLKRGQVYLNLYLNIINSGYLVPLFINDLF